MKQLTVLPAVFVVCFLIGAALVALSPTQIQAIDNPNPPACGLTCGTMVVCGAQESCNFGESMYYRCKQHYPELAECDGPWSCGCRAIGCGDLCEPR